MENGEVLIDTSVIITAQRDRKALLRLKEVSAGCAISRITANELIRGSRNSQEKRKNKEFVSYFNIIEIDKAISRHSYLLLERYCVEKSMGILDTIIASTAIVSKMELWTENKKHFDFIKGLQLYSDSHSL